MRHRKKRSKLGMMTAHRKAMLRNMVKNLLKHQRIHTTKAKAKETRRLAEKLITLSKSDTVASRRIAYSFLTNRDLVGKLFKETGPLFKNRNSGFTRIIPMGFRRGDGADMVILEFTEMKIVEKLPKAKEKGKKQEVKDESARKAGAKDASLKDVQEDHQKGIKKDEPKARMLPKTKPTLEEEKRTEKARSEEKKMADNRGFMKNIRGFFRKRGDR